MLFNSIEFILLFPIVVVIYYLVKRRYAYIWLAVVSYAFYACWNIKYLVYLIAVTAITYVFGLAMSKWKKKSKLWVAISVFFVFLILFILKYLDFSLKVLSFFGIRTVEKVDILVPVGISFYIFQSVTYIIDLYRQEVEIEKNIVRYALFVSFFPQIVSGPISRAKNFLPQLKERKYFIENNIKSGLLLMLWGFFQKLVIADRIAIVVNTVFNNIDKYTGFYVVIAILAYSVQIYCDFASYSNIAIGAAKMMGFELNNNFNAPYFASSVADFWRRWHISLSTWFRDYLYIPLGGNRKGKLRKYINIMIVFSVSGLWHGANTTFLVWGALNGAFQIVGMELMPLRNLIVKVLSINRNEFSHKLIKIFITYGLIDFTWIFFRSDSIGQALLVIKQMFSEFNPWIFFDESLYALGLDIKDMFVLFIALIVALMVEVIKYRNVIITDRFVNQGLWFRWLVYFGLVYTIIIFGIYGPLYDSSTFIYSNF